MDRVSFLESVSGIQYPQLIIQFFDQFIVLKEIVEDAGQVSVIKNTKNSILFLVEFSSAEKQNEALSRIPSSSFFTVYGKQIKVNIDVLTDKVIQIQLR